MFTLQKTLNAEKRFWIIGSWHDSKFFRTTDVYETFQLGNDPTDALLFEEKKYAIEKLDEIRKNYSGHWKNRFGSAWCPTKLDDYKLDSCEHCPELTKRFTVFEIEIKQTAIPLLPSEVEELTLFYKEQDLNAQKEKLLAQLNAINNELGSL